MHSTSIIITKDHHHYLLLHFAGEIIYTKAKMEVMNYLPVRHLLCHRIFHHLQPPSHRHPTLFKTAMAVADRAICPPSPTAEVGELHARRRFSRITSMSSAGGRPRSGPSFSISTGPSTPTPRTLTTPVWRSLSVLIICLYSLLCDCHDVHVHARCKFACAPHKAVAPTNLMVKNLHFSVDLKFSVKFTAYNFLDSWNAV